MPLTLKQIKKMKRYRRVYYLGLAARILGVLGMSIGLIGLAFGTINFAPIHIANLITCTALTIYISIADPRFWKRMLKAEHRLEILIQERSALELHTQALREGRCNTTIGQA